MLQTAEVINLILPRQRPKRQRQRLRGPDEPEIPGTAKDPRRRQHVQITPAALDAEAGGFKQRLPFFERTILFVNLGLVRAPLKSQSSR